MVHTQRVQIWHSVSRTGRRPAFLEWLTANNNLLPIAGLCIPAKKLGSGGQAGIKRGRIVGFARVTAAPDSGTPDGLRVSLPGWRVDYRLACGQH